ncbi:MAG: hypothetical protein H6748_22360 [Spirochaetaceae bacterium]|nr:hypothetical protein [Spirochaetaceae bacterium]
MSIVRLDIADRTQATAAHTRSASPAEEAAFLEDLRRRAAERLERGYRFLESQPDAWALARANVLFGAMAPERLTERLAATQREDGSLPPGTLVAGGGLGFPEIDPQALPEAERALVGSFEALSIAGDARLLHADWVEPALRFVESRQEADGSWRIGGAARPETDAVFWTGMCAGILGRSPRAKPAPLERAGDFLGARFAPERVEHRDGYPELLAYSHFFTNVAHDLADEALQWCGRALEKGFRSRELEAVATLRVLLTCDAQAMPGATFDVVELLERIFEEQAGDGGFAELSLGGPATRTTQTFDALLAIVRLCAALGD